jgi:hypothetical protein
MMVATVRQELTPVEVVEVQMGRVQTLHQVQEVMAAMEQRPLYLEHQSLVQVAEAVRVAAQKGLAVRVAAEMALFFREAVLLQVLLILVVVVAVLIMPLVRQAALASSLSSTR